jgi:hypothetical protein
VLYLIFNEGYAATAGDDWMRPGPVEDALPLGRILAELAPREPEVHGLVALMEIQASRAAGARGPSGEPVLLLDQDRSRWDHLLIRRGLAASTRAGGAGRRRWPLRAPGRHRRLPCRARTAAETDWLRIAALYDALRAAHPSPIVDLNRASRSAWPSGPRPGSSSWTPASGAHAPVAIHLLPAVRGDLLFKLGRFGRPERSSSTRGRAHAQRRARRSCSSGGRRRARHATSPSPARRGVTHDQSPPCRTGRGRARRSSLTPTSPVAASTSDSAAVPIYVRCGSTADVRGAVQEAVRGEGAVAVRSGGHCLEGFVADPAVRVVIDTSLMADVAYDARAAPSWSRREPPRARPTASCSSAGA